MDMQKIEAEFEFYGFTLDELKREYERLFRMHSKRMIDKFTENVINAAQRELTVETANHIKSLASNALNLIKPDTIKFLSKSNALIDKHFTIPAGVSIGGNSLQNTPDMDDYERKCKKDIAELELVYKQQAVMMAHLKAEMQLYDSGLIAEAEVDSHICDVMESILNDSNSNADVVQDAIHVLKKIEIDSKTISPKVKLKLFNS